MYGIVSGDELVIVLEQCSLLLDHRSFGARDSKVV